ncbi:hypothetical protein E4U56_005238 [Claviceps arundinis]|uniref:Uncharacterized protein n=1 Tax=Claviceps arundinis TaxID=1623583 RepID=A0A9P7MWA9_9HYPO|nr:hypothetical protein E4U56_005238 [Claviceps arundinis]
MRFQRTTLLLLSLLGSAASRHHPAPVLPDRLIHQFPPGIWIENLAVRSNGNLLLTTLTPNASVYEVVNPSSKNPSTELRFTATSVDSFFGIAELQPDIFAVLGGNHTPTAGKKGEWGVWLANFTNTNTGNDKIDSATIEPHLVVKLPEAVLLNGASAVPGKPHLVMAADSARGLVYRINVNTGKVDITQDLEKMKPVPVSVPHTDKGKGNNSTKVSIGINGVRIRNKHLYFTNSATHGLYRVQVRSDGSSSPSAFKTMVETMTVLDASFADDFDIGPGAQNTAWVVTNYNNSIISVSTGGDATLAAGGTGSPLIPSDTSCRFGRTAADDHVLYATTAGKLGENAEGGKVVAFTVGHGQLPHGDLVSSLSL